MFFSLTFKKLEQFCGHSGACDVDIDNRPNRIGEGVKDGFDRNVINRGVEKGPHRFLIIPALD